MSNQDRSNTTKKSTVYVALITALAIIIGSVILGLGGQTTPQEPTTEAAPAVELPNAGITDSNKATPIPHQMKLNRCRKDQLSERGV